MVKTLPSNAGGVGLIPGWETKVPHASWPNKTEKRSNIVTNSISLLKWSTSRKENPEQTQPMQKQWLLRAHFTVAAAGGRAAPLPELVSRPPVAAGSKGSLRSPWASLPLPQSLHWHQDL